MKISVYVPCYNSERTIEECIQSLKNQSLKPNEIIVINDCSIDNTTKKVKKFKVRILNHKENKGLAEARNTGIKNAKNELVAAIDSDCIAEKDWLKNLANSLNKKIVGVGGKLIEKEKTNADKWRVKHMRQHWGNKNIINPEYVAGNNTLFKKSIIKKINYYNKKYKTNYEDVDLCKRLRKQKYEYIYQPKAKAKHLAEDNTKSVLDRHWKHMFWDYPTPNTFSKKILKLIINFYTMLKFLLSDIFTRTEFIQIDMNLFFHHTKKDLKYK